MIRAIFFVAVAAAVMMACPAVGFSQRLETAFPNYIWSKKPATPPFGCNYAIPMIGRKETAYICADQVITPNSANDLTNKTIDCAVNNCTNFPGGFNWDTPVPTTCVGREGLPYFDGTVVTVCGAGCGSAVSLTADDGTTALTADDGISSLTFSDCVSPGASITADDGTTVLTADDSITVLTGG